MGARWVSSAALCLLQWYYLTLALWDWFVLFFLKLNRLLYGFTSTRCGTLMIFMRNDYNKSKAKIREHGILRYIF